MRGTDSKRPLLRGGECHDRAFRTRSDHLPSTPPPTGDAEPRPDRRPPAQSRFQAFVDSVFDAYYDWHIRTGYMEFSAQMDALLGLRPRHCRAPSRHGWTACTRTTVPPPWRPSTRRCARAACTGASTACAATTAPTSTCATAGWCSRRGRHSSHMVGAIRDVTGDQEAERALHEAAELYRTLFENAVNPAYQIAPTAASSTPTAPGAVHGDRQSALLRRGVGDLWGHAPTDAVGAATASGVATSLELELETATRQGAHAHPCALPLRGSGTCFALGTDITDHRTLAWRWRSRRLRYGSRRPPSPTPTPPFGSSSTSATATGPSSNAPSPTMWTP